MNELPFISDISIIVKYYITSTVNKQKLVRKNAAYSASNYSMPAY